MSLAHHKKRVGGPIAAEGMNILSCDVEDVAEAIKLRILARVSQWHVYVNDDGGVIMDGHQSTRRPHNIDSAWMIGVYTNKTPCAVIEDDLKERLREIQRQG